MRGEPPRVPSAARFRPGAELQWVTALFCAACVAIWLWLNFGHDLPMEEAALRVGLRTTPAIYAGEWWALLASTVVHFAVWHVGLNVYWMWSLGRPLEEVVGSLRFLTLAVISGFVSSTLQVAVYEGGGHGASGVVYGVFGYLWVAGRSVPGFPLQLDARIERFFIAWLGIGILLTQLDVLRIGNTAHVTGMLAGAALAGTLHRSRWALQARIGLVALLALSVGSLVYNPWSTVWVWQQGLEQHRAGNLEQAEALWDRAIDLEPRNAGAHWNRALIREARGDAEGAAADRERALELDPSVGGENR